MPLSIRVAVPADVPVVAELFDLYRQFYEQAPDASTARTFIADRMARGESVILLAEATDTQAALGFCQLYPSFCSVEAQPIYVLYDLFVLPAARKMGAGRALLLAAPGG
mgnify:FL=1